MKNRVIEILCFAILLTTASCDAWRVRMDTQVFRDGSCERTVWADSDTCLTRDASWHRSEIRLPRSEAQDLFDRGERPAKEPDTSKDSSRIYLIQKKFVRVEDMNAYPAVRIYGDTLRSQATLTKKFKWFYTDYTYTETFAGCEDHFSIPVTDYMQREEASFMWTGYPELPQGLTGMEITEYVDVIYDKATRWQYAVYFDIVCQVIARHYDDVENPPVDRETFLSMCDQLADYAWKQDRDNDAFYRMVADSHIELFFKEFFHSDAYSVYFHGEKDYQYSNEMEAYYIQHYGMLSLNALYRLKMPGRITDPGRGTITDGIINYNLNGTILIPGDYTITATSRAVNVWAFAVLLFVITVAAGSFLGPRRNNACHPTI